MPRTYGERCPVARSLDLVGGRWTLLLVRDLLYGPLRFSELRRRFPDLAPNLLSARLAALVDAGLVERLPHRGGYQLTERGRELRFVIGELARFGSALLDDLAGASLPQHRLPGLVLSLTRPEHLDRRGWRARLDLGRGAPPLLLTVDAASRGRRAAGRVHVHPLDHDAEPRVDLHVAASPAALRAGRRRGVTIEGAPWAAQRFCALLELEAAA